jgi:AGCS family alanine or glycine:cation symporter
MIDHLLDFIEILDDKFWKNIGFPIIILTGIYLTIRTRAFQIRTLIRVKKLLTDLINDSKQSERGTNPIKLYFASIGGMVGVGNMVGVVSAVTIGGPGALVWMWVASFSGMLIKYSEIYLGVTYRVQNSTGGFDGGPMYYLKKAFPSGIPSMIAAFLLCIYSVEIYQFTVISDSISSSLNLNKVYVVSGLLILIFAGALGGVTRLANICTAIMPVFIVTYLIISFIVIWEHFSAFSEMIPVVFQSAFSGHAAVGGFAGSSLVLAAQNGIARTVYSGDIGIGYDSIIQSETRVRHPEKQARIAIIALFTDTFICTLSCLVVLVTGSWTLVGYNESQMIYRAFGISIPYANYVVMVLIFIGAISTITGYMVVGQKCAKYISPRFGQAGFLVFALCSFVLFAFDEQTRVLKIMSITGGMLMFCNLMGIVKLRRSLKF